MKIPNPYFKAVPQYGDLQMEQIIVDYVYPLLSVLKDSKNRRYLCMCFDTRGSQQQLITPISINTLVAILENKITLSAPFEDFSTEKVLAVRNYQTKEETFQLLHANEVPKVDLPEEGEYLDSELGEWEEYVEMLRPIAPNVKRFIGYVISYNGKRTNTASCGWSDIRQIGRKTGECMLCMVK